MKLLFVCTGNTCRSCMAEAIAGDMARNMNINASIESAGIYAAGDGASENAIKVMKEMGLDLSGHISKSVSYKLLEKSDLVLTMTRGHKSSILSSFPEFQGKVFTLFEYIGEDGEVLDPFGSGLATYRRTAAQLKGVIEKLFYKIKEG